MLARKGALRVPYLQKQVAAYARVKRCKTGDTGDTRRRMLLLLLLLLAPRLRLLPLPPPLPLLLPQPAKKPTAGAAADAFARSQLRQHAAAERRGQVEAIRVTLVPETTHAPVGIR